MGVPCSFATGSFHCCQFPTGRICGCWFPTNITCGHLFPTCSTCACRFYHREHIYHRLPAESSSSSPDSTRSTHEFLSYREQTCLPISHRDQPCVLVSLRFLTLSISFQPMAVPFKMGSLIGSNNMCIEIKPDLRWGIPFLHETHGPWYLILIRFAKGASMPASVP